MPTLLRTPVPSAILPIKRSNRRLRAYVYVFRFPPGLGRNLNVNSSPQILPSGAFPRVDLPLSPPLLYEPFAARQSVYRPPQEADLPCVYYVCVFHFCWLSRSFPVLPERNPHRLSRRRRLRKRSPKIGAP